MRHHNDEYLLSNIKIIEWHLCYKNGMRITYELDGETFFLMADKQRILTLLDDVRLINGRRILAGIMQVNWLGMWLSFKDYAVSVDFDIPDLLLIVARHEGTKAVERISDIYIAARMKPLNWN